MLFLKLVQYSLLITSLGMIQSIAKFRLGSSILTWRKWILNQYPASNEDQANFCQESENRLVSIPIPTCVESCADVKYKMHTEELNNYCEDILNAVDLSEKEQLPMTKPPSKKGAATPNVDCRFRSFL